MIRKSDRRGVSVNVTDNTSGALPFPAYFQPFMPLQSMYRQALSVAWP